MIRRTPLKRQAMKRTRPKATDNPAYLRAVRQLPCCAITVLGHSCMGTIVAHHAGKHGMGQRCSDMESIALCSLGHTNLHDLNGCFTHWTRQEIRAWEDEQIRNTQLRLGVPLTKGRH